VLLWASPEVNYRVDITDTFETKLAALRCHKSQVGTELSPGLEEWVRERSREMAEGEDFDLAEGFHRERIWR
jgi:LmbE family N-acetylglucosaminyl deacetylase